MKKVEFYNVKKKTKVQIAAELVEKKTYQMVTKGGNKSTRYALKAVDEDGTKLTKFCSKADYDAI